MPVILPLSDTLASAQQTVQLGTQRFGIRTTWRERAGAWYLDLMTEQGARIVSGLRLDGGNSPGLRLGSWRAQGPGGALYVRGPSPYVREDLGAALSVVWYSDSELPEAADSGLFVEV